MASGGLAQNFYRPRKTAGGPGGCGLKIRARLSERFIIIDQFLSNIAYATLIVKSSR